jgi:hypothetical protein
MLDGLRQNFRLFRSQSGFLTRFYRQTKFFITPLANPVPICRRIIISLLFRMSHSAKQRYRRYFTGKKPIMHIITIKAENINTFREKNSKNLTHPD